MNMNFKNIILFLITFALIYLLTRLSGPFGKDIYSASAGDGLGVTACAFLYIFTSISMALILQNNKDKVNTKTYRIIAWLFFLYIVMYYFVFTHFAPSILILFNPLVFIPLFIIFIYLIRGTKYFKRYLAIFFAIPILFLLIIHIQIQYFLLTCENKTPKPEYNPIYLPEEFFHEETVNEEKVLRPNIKDSTEIRNNKLFTKTDENLIDINPSKYIYIGLVVFLREVLLMKKKRLRDYIKLSNSLQIMDT